MLLAICLVIMISVMIDIVKISIINRNKKRMDKLVKEMKELDELIQEYKKQQNLSNIYVNPDGKLIYEDDTLRAVVNGVKSLDLISPYPAINLIFFTSNMVIIKKQND